VKAKKTYQFTWTFTWKASCQALVSQSQSAINLESGFPEDIPREFTGKHKGHLPLYLPIASEDLLPTRFLD
jgi:hypothetical protein